MTTIPQLTAKQAEAIDALVDLYSESRKQNPDARAAFLGAALLLAQTNALDYLVAALLIQAKALNIPPTNSLLFRDMAFDIEEAMHEQNKGGKLQSSV